MKHIIALVFTFLVVAIHAKENWKKIDWTKVVPVTDLPGFWKDREIKPKKQLNSRSSRIGGGLVVAPNSIPFQAALLSTFPTGVGLCGGSVISENTILTAAHCVFGTTTIEVILGADLLFVEETTQQHFTIEPSAHHVHTGYNTSNFNNDIAILTTPSQIAFNAWVSPVALPALGDTSTFVGQFATVSGWGKTADGSAISSHLRSVRNFLISNADCTAVFDIVTEGTICMSTGGNRAPCGGDSGGPLTVVRNNSVLQVGVVSFGASSGGCGYGYPAGFARITAYRYMIV